MKIDANSIDPEAGLAEWGNLGSRGQIINFLSKLRLTKQHTCSTSSNRYKTPLCLGHDSDALTDSFFLVSRGYIIVTTVEITSCASLQEVPLSI
jgi:hypothetical protein